MYAICDEMLPLWLCAIHEDVPNLSLTHTSKASVDNFQGVGKWTLCPDPLFEHCFHLLNLSNSSAYYIDMKWISEFKRVISIPEMSSPLPADLPKTSCLQLLQQTKCSRLSGWYISSDAVDGHVAMYRTLNGAIQRVNMFQQIRSVFIFLSRTSTHTLYLSLNTDYKILSHEGSAFVEIKQKSVTLLNIINIEYYMPLKIHVMLSSQMLQYH